MVEYAMKRNGMSLAIATRRSVHSQLCSSFALIIYDIVVGYLLAVSSRGALSLPHAGLRKKRSKKSTIKKISGKGNRSLLEIVKNLNILRAK